MGSSDEEVIVIAAIAKSVLEKRQEKNVKENFG